MHRYSPFGITVKVFVKSLTSRHFFRFARFTTDGGNFKTELLSIKTTQKGDYVTPKQREPQLNRDRFISYLKVTYEANYFEDKTQCHHKDKKYVRLRGYSRTTLVPMPGKSMNDSRGLRDRQASPNFMAFAQRKMQIHNAHVMH